jgi:uncharacterized membrane protein YdfJ with MMPL/SSD domain
MSSLTRWILAHTRIVVIGWIALTIAGIAASGPASKRLANDSSVPAKEGWETTAAIAERYDGNPDGAACRCYRWLRCRRARRSTRPA